MTKDERLEILLRCLHVRWPLARDLSNSGLRDIANAFEDAIAEIADRDKATVR